MYKALVTAEVNIETLRNTIKDVEFDTAGYIVSHEVMESEELAKIIEPYDILISEFETVTQKVIEKAENLKLIICCRGGVKSVIDMKAAEKKHVCVMHNAGRNASAVSEIVMGYILDLCRNISKSNHLIHEKKITSDKRMIPSEYKDTIWGLNDSSPYHTLRGKSPRLMTLGIVGFGNVGRDLAKKAEAFGMKILIYDPLDVAISRTENIKAVSFEELLKESDVVSLHCPLTADNKDMMNAETFSMMKDGAYFINAARGGLVDEDALFDALVSGKLSGAALDVVKKEPISNEYKLLDAPNLIITPHIAGASDEVVYKGTEMVIHKLINYLGDERVM